jgi:hypothetical protein
MVLGRQEGDNRLLFEIHLSVSIKMVDCCFVGLQCRTLAHHKVVGGINAVLFTYEKWQVTRGLRMIALNTFRGGLSRSGTSPPAATA